MKLASNNDQKSVACVDPNANYSQGEEEWKVRIFKYFNWTI
jgi:hypothetical protein